MSSLKLTARAKIDLLKIARYTRYHWGVNQRNVYLKEFDAAFTLLEKTPTIGNRCEFIRAGYRKFLLGSHVIYYKVNINKQVSVIRILHKNMDVNLRL